VEVFSPIRCTRCKAYANPNFKFDSLKKSAVCNICGIKFAIDVKQDQNNSNEAVYSGKGIYDFVVKDKIYMKKRLDLIKIIIAI
jgi:hypothetical protein